MLGRLPLFLKNVAFESQVAFSLLSGLRALLFLLIRGLMTSNFLNPQTSKICSCPFSSHPEATFPQKVAEAHRPVCFLSPLAFLPSPARVTKKDEVFF